MYYKFEPKCRYRNIPYIQHLGSDKLVYRVVFVFFLFAGYFITPHWSTLVCFLVSQFLNNHQVEDLAVSIARFISSDISTFYVLYAKKHRSAHKESTEMFIST